MQKSVLVAAQNAPKMRPLIKWAGGKSREIKHIEKIIPPFDRYFEPFFGGGAVYFALEPHRAYINDVTSELIDFYRYIQNGKRHLFKQELEKYVEHWERISLYMEKFGNSILDIFARYKRDNLSHDDFVDRIDALFRKNIVPFNGLFAESFAINRESLLSAIKTRLVAKLGRVKSVIDTANRFSDDEVMKNVETAFRSGFYIHFRDIMNQSANQALKLAKERRIANYYFVREFCYGGMFRFNRNGEFNVPYGGNAYNNKDFRKKVKHVFSEGARRLLRQATIENLDFQSFLEKHRPKRNDFVFLDPPYDTEFSEYEENPFTKDDQQRLADTLRRMEAKFILVIKETPFVRKLYADMTGITIRSFNKEYLFNIRERNNRAVRHLVIHNLGQGRARRS